MADKFDDEISGLMAARRERDAKREAEQKAAQQKLDEQRAEYIEARDSIIRPALEEIAKSLNHNGIEGRISIDDKDAITLEIIEPEIKYSPPGFPCVTFSFSGKNVRVFERTMGGRKGSGHAGNMGSIGIGEVAPDTIKERAIKVIREVLG